MEHQKIRFKIKDRYKIDIFDHNNYALFLSIVIAFDNSIHNEIIFLVY